MRIEVGIGIPRGKRKSSRRTSVIQISNMFHICISICLCLFAIVCTTLQRTFVIDPLALCNPPTHIPAHIHTYTHGATIQLKPQLQQQHFFQQTRVYLEVFIEFTSPTCPTLSSSPLPLASRGAQLTGPTGSSAGARCIMPGHTFSNSIPA